MDKINEQKAIGEFLKKLRVEAKLSVRKEAEMIGVDRRRLSACEKGKSVLSILEARELARLHHVSLTEIANAQREEKTDLSQISAEPEALQTQTKELSKCNNLTCKKRTKSYEYLASMCKRIHVNPKSMTQERRNTKAIMMLENELFESNKSPREKRIKSQGLIDSMCEKINIKLNEMTEDRKNTVAIMTLLVALFILAFCPVFSQGLKEPLTWVIAPIFIILELLAIKYLPDEWFERKGRKEKKRE